MPVPILAARYVHKTYGRGPSQFHALRGVSVDVAEGESLAIVGKSGSGKSTLMHLMALLDQPSDGAIELSGRNSATLKGGVLNQTRNSTFGFVFQQFFLTPNTSVLDNVTLPLRIAGVRGSERRRRGMQALEQLELGDKAKSKANDLSGGQKQRVVIARALVNNPHVIFADEPTGNLDSATGAVVEDILLGLNQSAGITLIVVTHARHRTREPRSMNTFDLTRTAISNSLRSRSRTALTVVAIFLGAFTLTLTNAVGNGVNTYIDDTVSAIGAKDVLTVTKTQGESGDGPERYDPSTTLTTSADGGPDGGTVEAITAADGAKLREIDGVLSAEPVLSVRPDYVSYDDGKQYQLTIGGFVPGSTLQLLAGAQPQWDSRERQIALPESYIDPLDFEDAEDAIGKVVILGVTDDTGKASTVNATVVAVTQPGPAGGDTSSANNALTRTLYDRQSVGLSTSAKQSYSEATVRFDEAGTAADLTALKDRLTDAGYDSQIVEEEIGAFKTVIDSVILILNGFAVIALLAAGFGIVNTLLMSVQERTREIGLMKAMGLGGGRIFALFSLEAVFIGLLGSALGVGAAVATGLIANTVLAGGLLADLPGLALTVFTPMPIGVIVLIVMGIAFLAGTIPALRAARQNPIESLRYE